MSILGDAFSRPMRRKLLRGLRARVWQLAALVAIVAIGVACWVGMTGVFRDLDGARERYYRENRLPDLTVSTKRAPLWAVEALTELPNVRTVRGRIVLPVLVDLPGSDESIAGTAYSLPVERVPVLADVELLTGVWFSGRDDREVLINDSFAAANHLRPGDRLRVLVQDRRHELLIVGTVMSPEFVYLIPVSGGLAPDPEHCAVIYLGRDFLEAAADLSGAANQVLGITHDTDATAIANTLTRIEQRLEAYGVVDSGPMSEQVSVRFLHDELLGLKVSARIMPLVFLIVAALVLNILLARLVVQERVVIGTLSAIGLSRGALVTHYLAFALSVGLAGGVIGLGLGLLMQQGLVTIYRQFYPMPGIDLHLYADIIAGGVGIGLVFSALGAWKSVRYAAGLAPAEAMRPPPPERGGRVLPERIGWLWTRLPFHWKLILRTLFRNPYRTSVGILASLVSTALIVSTFSSVDALDYMMQHQFRAIVHHDISVALREPAGPGALAEVETFSGVVMAEPQLAVACDLVSGSRRKRVGVTGLEPHHSLYTPRDREGREVEIPAVGLALSRKLAELLDVKAGDDIWLRPLVGQRVRSRAVVATLVDDYMGLSAYADLAYLSRLIGEERAISVVFARVDGAHASPGFSRDARARPAVIGTSVRTRSLEQMQATMGETMGLMIWIFVLIAGLIAFGSVLNSALVSLSERQREVATLRVLGYSPLEVARIFSGESVLANSLGIGLGLIAGIGLAHLMSSAYDTELYRFPVVILPHRLVEAAIYMSVFVMAAQLAVLRLVIKLDWLTVLKVRE